MSSCRGRWWWGGLLFASLALNLFLAGWLFGGDHFRAPPQRGPGAFFASLERKADALPEPTRSNVKQVLATHQPELRKQMRRTVKTRDAIDRLYKRADYNRAEAEQQYAILQAQSLVMQEKVQAMMLELADELPQESRAAFMERPREHRGRGDEFRPRAKPPAR